MVTISHFKKKEVKNNMTNEQDAMNLFDKIRADAVKKRQDRIEEKRKSDEFLAKIKNEANPLEQINKKLHLKKIE